MQGPGPANPPDRPVRPRHAAASRPVQRWLSKVRTSIRFKMDCVIGRLLSANVNASEQVERCGTVQGGGDCAGRLGGRARQKITGIIDQGRSTTQRADRPEPKDLVQARDRYLVMG